MCGCQRPEVASAEGASGLKFSRCSWYNAATSSEARSVNLEICMAERQPIQAGDVISNSADDVRPPGVRSFEGGPTVIRSRLEWTALVASLVLALMLTAC